jgi:hypothetical protein
MRRATKHQQSTRLPLPKPKPKQEFSFAHAIFPIKQFPRGKGACQSASVSKSQFPATVGEFNAAFYCGNSHASAQRQATGLIVAGPCGPLTAYWAGGLGFFFVFFVFVGGGGTGAGASSPDLGYLEALASGIDDAISDPTIAFHPMYAEVAGFSQFSALIQFLGVKGFCDCRGSGLS